MKTISTSSRASFEPFEALDRQLRQFSSFPQQNLPTYAATPQPSAPDLDLTAYQIADSAWQKVKQAGDAVQDKLEAAAPWLALGGLLVATLVGVAVIDRVVPTRR